MKLSELENGNVIELRNGEQYLKVDDMFLNLNMKGCFLWVSEYNADLCNCITTKYDIMKIAFNEKTDDFKNMNLIKARDGKWNWVRVESVLTKQEKNYLSAVIEPFKEQVIAIKKVRYGDLSHEADFIKIICKSITKGLNCETIDFITFEKGSKYKGMDYDYEYTLDQLGLN